MAEESRPEDAAAHPEPNQSAQPGRKEGDESNRVTNPVDRQADPADLSHAEASSQPVAGLPAEGHRPYVAHYVDPYDDTPSAAAEGGDEGALAAEPHTDTYTEAYVAAWRAAHTKAYTEAAAETRAIDEPGARRFPAATPDEMLLAAPEAAPLAHAQPPAESPLSIPAEGAAEPGAAPLEEAAFNSDRGAPMDDQIEPAETGAPMSAFEYLMSTSRRRQSEGESAAPPEDIAHNGAPDSAIESAAARFEFLLKSDWGDFTVAAKAVEPPAPAAPAAVLPAAQPQGAPPIPPALAKVASEATTEPVSSAPPRRSLLLEEELRRESQEPVYEEAPDLLRWRAEMLLDEMMVGAVDASAGEEDAPYRPAHTPTDRPRAYEGQVNGNGASVRPLNGSRGPDDGLDYESAAAPPESDGRVVNGSASHGSARELLGKPGRSRMPTPITPAVSSPAGRTPAVAQPAPEPTPAPAAERWQPAVYQGTVTDRTVTDRTVATPAQPAAQPHVTPRPATSPSPRSPAPLVSPVAGAAAEIAPSKMPRRIGGREEDPAPAREPARAPADNSPRKLMAVEKRYPRSDRRRRQSGTAAGAHYDGDLLGLDDENSPLGPIRRNPAVISNHSVTGAMNVVNRNNARYATLLPRSTPWDVHEMEREIASLSDEMARVLPHNHDSSRRARHLLEKAQTIFDSDPLRSAEVDYYLSQVRAIVQRSRQTMQWSGMYHNKLMVYLWAWILLSATVVAGALLFGSGLRLGLTTFLGVDADGQTARSLVPAVVAMFGGSLGGALGAMLNLRRYQRMGIGYIDRKYSLLGLVLPLIGFLIGLVFFAVVGAALWLMGSTATWPLYLELIPALLAFVYGVVQESIYGTRD